MRIQAAYIHGIDLTIAIHICVGKLFVAQRVRAADMRIQAAHIHRIDLTITIYVAFQAVADHAVIPGRSQLSLFSVIAGLEPRNLQIVIAGVDLVRYRNQNDRSRQHTRRRTLCISAIGNEVILVFMKFNVTAAAAEITDLKYILKLCCLRIGF